MTHRSFASIRALPRIEIWWNLFPFTRYISFIFAGSSWTSRGSVLGSELGKNVVSWHRQTPITFKNNDSRNRCFSSSIVVFYHRSLFFIIDRCFFCRSFFFCIDLRFFSTTLKTLIFIRIEDSNVDSKYVMSRKHLF